MSLRAPGSIWMLKHYPNLTFVMIWMITIHSKTSQTMIHVTFGSLSSITDQNNVLFLQLFCFCWVHKWNNLIISCVIYYLGFEGGGIPPPTPWVWCFPLQNPAKTNRQRSNNVISCTDPKNQITQEIIKLFYQRCSKSFQTLRIEWFGRFLMSHNDPNLYIRKAWDTL